MVHSIYLQQQIIVFDSDCSRTTASCCGWQVYGAKSAVQQISNNTTDIPRCFCFIHHSGRFCPGCIHSHRCPSCGGPHPVTRCHTQQHSTSSISQSINQPFRQQQRRPYRPSSTYTSQSPSNFGMQQARYQGSRIRFQGMRSYPKNRYKQ